MCWAWLLPTWVLGAGAVLPLALPPPPARPHPWAPLRPAAAAGGLAAQQGGAGLRVCAAAAARRRLALVNRRSAALPALPCPQVVRKNFLLVYELLDEVLDYGFPQARTCS